MDKVQYVRQIQQRHQTLAWWARVNRDYPHGVVPVSTASRILSVSPARIRKLISEGRLSCLDDMPGGSTHDKFVPIIDLIDAPFSATRGRPGVYGPKNRPTNKKDEKNYEYNKSLQDKYLAGEISLGRK